MRKSAEWQEREALKGLCVSCRKASHCTYLKNATRPILQCDEFEGYPCKPREDVPASNLKISHGEMGAVRKEENKILGLCANCKHRDECTFPKPPGGVWQCEEYE